MSLGRDLETQIDAVLHSNTVGKAQRILSSRSGVVMVSAISFVESALPAPILTDPFLIAAVLANRTNVLRLVIATTIASVVGGVLAYLMAALFLETLLHWMTPALIEQFQQMVSQDQANTFMLTLIGAVTPVPYTLAAWAIAVLKGGLLVFIGTSVVGRGLRYAIVGYSTYHFGEFAVQYAKRYIGLTSVLLFIAAALYIWLKM